MSKSQANFEKSFTRLEEILEEMNTQGVGLDQSLKLYEEADKLIVTCHKKLSSAEQKIEKLIKDREGALMADEKGTPQTEDFE